MGETVVNELNNVLGLVTPVVREYGSAREKLEALCRVPAYCR